MSKRKHPPPKPWEARIPGTPPPNRIAFPKRRPPPTAGTTIRMFWAPHYVTTLTSEPNLAERGVHTWWDRQMVEMVETCDGYSRITDVSMNKARRLPTPNSSTNQDTNMPHDAPHHTLEQAHKQARMDQVTAGFVHPSQHTLRTWATQPLPVIEMPLQGVAWHSPKTQEPGGSHSTPGLTLRSTRVRDDLFFAIADGVDSPVQVQFRIPMAALVTMLVRYQSLSEKPGGYMMYLTEDGELRFPTSDDTTLAGPPAPSDSNKE